MNPSILWLAAALLTWGTGEGMFYIFQPIYLSQLGANPVTIGYILGASGFIMMIAHIPAGYLADRFGRRPVLIAGWLVGITAAWIMALSPSLPFFITGLLLYGSTIFVSAPLNSYITAARGKWSIARAITLVSATYNLGNMIGPFTGGWIGDHFGLRSVYFVAGMLFIISTLFIFKIAPQPHQAHDAQTPPPSIFANRRFPGFLALGFIVILVLTLPQSFTAKFLQEVRGLSLGQIGFLGTVGGAGNTTITLLLGSLDARLGFLLGQLGVGLYSGLLWKMNAYGWFAVAYFALGGFRASRSLFMALIRPLVHETQMGLAFGISETVLGLAGILAPITAGFIYQQDSGLVYPVALAATLLVLILSLFFTPRASKEKMQPVLEIIE